MKLMTAICLSDYYTQRTSYLTFTYLGGPEIVTVLHWRVGSNVGIVSQLAAVAVLFVLVAPVEKSDSSQVVLTGRDMGDLRRLGRRTVNTQTPISSFKPLFELHYSSDACAVAINLIDH
jgi:hypothetical protein